MKLVSHFQLGEVDLLGVASYGDGFVVVGRNGAVFERDRGGVWSRVDVAFDEDLYGVCRCDGGWLLVGGNLHVGGNSKVVVLGDDGSAEVQASGVQSLLLSVAADEREAWACGFNGDLVRRVDGEWRQVTDLNHFDHLFAIDLAGGKVTTAGLGGWVHERGLDGSWTSTRLSDGHWFGAATNRGATCAAGGGGAVWAHGGLRTFGRATWQCITSVGDDLVVAGTGGMTGWIGGVPQQIGQRTWYGVAAGELVVLVGAEGWVAELEP